MCRKLVEVQVGGCLVPKFADRLSSSSWLGQFAASGANYLPADGGVHKKVRIKVPARAENVGDDGKLAQFASPWQDTSCSVQQWELAVSNEGLD